MAAFTSLAAASNAIGGVGWPSTVKVKYPDSMDDAVVLTRIVVGTFPSCTVYACPYGLFPIRPAALISSEVTSPRDGGKVISHA